jgi:hypothetical protein
MAVGHFLVRGEANLIGTIILGLVVVIILPHTIENRQEEFSGHHIAATRCLLFKNWINWIEVVLVEAQVASLSIAMDVSQPLL